MEMISGVAHTAFPIDDTSRVGEARRFAAGLAQSLGWTDVLSGRLSIVVTELATNLVKHARGGRLLLAARTHASEIEIVCIDDGPGIQDVARCFEDGFSTGGSPGTGLGAIRRLADEFDIHSAPGEGTVSVARLRAQAARGPAGALRVGAISLALQGETVCGDAWGVCIDGARAAVTVADGLGHGAGAAQASEAAVGVFLQEPFGDMRSVLQATHTELRTTRGAAICNLQLDGDARAIRSSGAGNVMARIISGVSDKTVVTQHGTVGLQVRRFEEAANEWPDHALVVVHTDGVTSRWGADTLHPVLSREPTLAAALVLRAHSRGRDDATVVVVARRA